MFHKSLIGVIAIGIMGCGHVVENSLQAVDKDDKQPLAVPQTTRPAPIIPDTLESKLDRLEALIRQLQNQQVARDQAYKNYNTCFKSCEGLEAPRWQDYNSDDVEEGAYQKAWKESPRNKCLDECDKIRPVDAGAGC